MTRYTDRTDTKSNKRRDNVLMKHMMLQNEMLNPNQRKTYLYSRTGDKITNYQPLAIGGVTNSAR